MPFRAGDKVQFKGEPPFAWYRGRVGTVTNADYGIYEGFGRTHGLGVVVVRFEVDGKTYEYSGHESHLEAVR